MTILHNSSSNEAYNDESYYNRHRDEKSMTFLEKSSWYA